jgi:hypothetical protein
LLRTGLAKKKKEEEKKRIKKKVFNTRPEIYLLLPRTILLKSCLNDRETLHFGIQRLNLVSHVRDPHLYPAG